MQQPTTYEPAQQLKKYIASYGIIEVEEGKTEPYFSPPLGLSGFIIQVINTHGTVDAKIQGTDFFTSREVVTGQVTQPVYGQLIGHVKSLLIFFTPLGMHQLFGNDMSLIKNKSLTLAEFLGEEEAGLLIEALKSDMNSETQINVLNRFFSSKLPVQSKEENLEEVLAYIHSRNGGVSIKEVVKKFGFSRKTLERQFKFKIGLSPAVYAQIYQFKSLMILLQSNPQITWTELANQAGYFDQSHMSRYVKEYLKVSPTSIVKLDIDFINYLLSR